MVIRMARADLVLRQLVETANKVFRLLPASEPGASALNILVDPIAVLTSTLPNDDSFRADANDEGVREGCVGRQPALNPPAQRCGYR